MSAAVRSVWRSRAALFAVLGLLLVANVAILVSHRVFYEARLQSLQETEKELLARRDEARAAAAKAAANERRVHELRASLDRFYSETLGSRQERLAPLIEEIYETTRKAGFDVESVSYAESDAPGATRMALTFAVQGTYEELKKLLAGFENNPGFLVLETVNVGTNDQNPDMLRVSLTVAHYFRAEAGARSAARAARRAKPEAAR